MYLICLAITAAGFGWWLRARWHDYKQADRAYHLSLTPIAHPPTVRVIPAVYDHERTLP